MSNGILWGNFGTEKSEVTLDGQQYNLYDADSVLKKKQVDTDSTKAIESEGSIALPNEKTIESHRILDIDAPEYPKLTKEGEFKSPEYFAQDYRDLVESKINEGGFTSLNPTGKKDVYGRQLSTIEDSAGLSLGYDLTQQGYLEPSRYSLDNLNLAAAGDRAVLNSKAKLDEDMMVQSYLPAWKQIENAVQQRMKMDTIDRDINVSSLSRVFQDQSDPMGYEPDSQVVDSVQLWWYQTKGAFEGLKALAGVESGYQGMKDVEKDIYENIDPNTVLSLQQVEDPLDFLSFARNMLISQGIDYAVLAGGGAAGTAIGGPVGGVIGASIALGYNFLKSTGNVAQEQYGVTGEVDPGEALFLGTVITALDKISAGARLSPYQVLTKEGMEATVKQVAKANSISEAAARKLVKQTTAEEIRKIATQIGIKSTAIATSRDLTLSMLTGLGKKAGLEGGTELVQEGLQALTINGIPETAQEWEDLGWRAADAFVGGSVVGGVYNIGDSLRQRHEVEMLQDSLFNEYDPKRSSFDTKTYMEGTKAAKRDYGTVSTEQIIRQYRDKVNQDEGPTFDERVKNARVTNYVGSALAKISRGEYIPLLSSVHNMFRGKIRNEDGSINTAVLALSDIEGGTSVLHGNTKYDNELMALGEYTLRYKWLDNLEHLNVDKQKFDTIVKELRDNFFQVNLTNLSPEDKELANNIKQQVGYLNAEILEEYRKVGLPKKKLQALESKGFGGLLLANDIPDTKLIRQNYGKFINELAKLTFDDGIYQGRKVGEEEAETITKRLFKGDLAYVEGRLEAIKNKDSLKEFFPVSSYDTLRNKALKHIVNINRNKFTGDENALYAAILNDAVNKGLSEEKANELAFDLKQLFDKQAGTFGRLKNKALSTTQDVTRSMTSFALMDNVIFSQMGEVMISFIGTNQPVSKQLSGFAKNFVTAIADSLPIISKKREKQQAERVAKGEDLTPKDIMKLSGFKHEELLQQQGTDLDNKFLRKAQSIFYKVNLLQQSTDALRLNRMMAAQDSFDQIVEELVNADFNNLTHNQAKHAARLASYGIDVERLVSLYKIRPTYKFKNIGKLSEKDPSYRAVKELEKIWIKALPKFIDEFTVRVKPGSRPTIYEDSRFGLPFLTQYLSFISHFHANILPKLYQNYLRTGTTKMAYTTFQQMALAITAAYVSQYLKDLLLKGELHPNLKDGGDIQRAIEYSGLLGQGQDLVNVAIGNSYGMETKGFFDYFTSSPTISHFTNVGKDIAKEDYTGAAQRALPFGEYTKEEAATRKLFDMVMGNNSE